MKTITIDYDLYQKELKEHETSHETSGLYYAKNFIEHGTMSPRHPAIYYQWIAEAIAKRKPKTADRNYGLNHATPTMHEVHEFVYGETGDVTKSHVKTFATDAEATAFIDGLIYQHNKEVEESEGKA